MKYFFIALTVISILSLLFSGAIYAGTSTTANKVSQTVAAGNGGKRPTDAQSIKINADSKEKKVQETGFSGYPESYVIPSGVCETKDPVMTINK